LSVHIIEIIGEISENRTLLPSTAGKLHDLLECDLDFNIIAKYHKINGNFEERQHWKPAALDNKAILSVNHGQE